MKESKHPAVYIIIINWNGEKHLEYCLPSVTGTDYPNYRIIVVDNGSTDGSRSFISKFKNIELIENDRNLGFAQGNNIGIYHALKKGAEYIVLLNNDTLVDKDWITEAVNCAKKDPKIGMIGFNVFGAERPANISDFKNAVKNKMRSFRYSENYVCGCAMFVTRALIERIGVLDPVYFAYEEEIDWGKRAKKAGYRIAEVDAPVFHNLFSTAKKILPRASFLQVRNTLRNSIKNDSITEIIRRFIAVTNTACNPFKMVDRESAVFKRLRPFNPLLNFVILVNAFAWNLLTLPQTLYSRRRRFSLNKNAIP